MATISSRIQHQPYKIEITSATGNYLVADEPLANGGQDLGFSAKELLAASLAACTSATLKMYANRKQWNLEEVKTAIDLVYLKEENKTVIKRTIELIGNLDEEQRKRLMAVANACPIHKILTQTIEIHTE